LTAAFSLWSAANRSSKPRASSSGSSHVLPMIDPILKYCSCAGAPSPCPSESVLSLLALWLCSVAPAPRRPAMISSGDCCVCRAFTSTSIFSCALLLSCRTCDRICSSSSICWRMRLSATSASLLLRPLLHAPPSVVAHTLDTSAAASPVCTSFDSAGILGPLPLAVLTPEAGRRVLGDDATVSRERSSSETARPPPRSATRLQQAQSCDMGRAHAAARGWGCRGAGSWYCRPNPSRHAPVLPVSSTAGEGASNGPTRSGRSYSRASQPAPTLSRAATCQQERRKKERRVQHSALSTRTTNMV